MASGFGSSRSAVKPARLGSSVGITPASGRRSPTAAAEQAGRHDPRVIGEAPAPGKEVECSLLGNEDPIASPPGEIDTKGHDWYDYEAKYAEGGMEWSAPAGISADADGVLRDLARQVFTLWLLQRLGTLRLWSTPQGDGLPGVDVHRVVRRRLHRRLDRPVEGNDRGSASRDFRPSVLSSTPGAPQLDDVTMASR